MYSNTVNSFLRIHPGIQRIWRDVAVAASGAEEERELGKVVCYASVLLTT